jgi:hypothetical protein
VNSEKSRKTWWVISGVLDFALAQRLPRGGDPQVTGFTSRSLYVEAFEQASHRQVFPLFGRHLRRRQRERLRG